MEGLLQGNGQNKDLRSFRIYYFFLYISKNNFLLANEAATSNQLDDTDGDLRLTGSEINVIDPISKMRMTDPVRNAICGHVYDKESLVAMLRKNKNTRYVFLLCQILEYVATALMSVCIHRCPVVGCTSMDYIVLSQCRPDIVTKTYLERNPA